MGRGRRNSIYILYINGLGIIIGLILSDGFLVAINKGGKNARLLFGQGMIHFEYFWSVFTSPIFFSSLKKNKFVLRTLGKA